MLHYPEWNWFYNNWGYWINYLDNQINQCRWNLKHVFIFCIIGKCSVNFSAHQHHCRKKEQQASQSVESVDENSMKCFGIFKFDSQYLLLLFRRAPKNWLNHCLCHSFQQKKNEILSQNCFRFDRFDNFFWQYFQYLLHSSPRSWLIHLNFILKIDLHFVDFISTDVLHYQN